jgi:hypothetical protein
VLGAPHRGVGGVDGDDGQVPVGGHLGQAVPEPAGGDAGHQPAIGPSPLSSARAPTVAFPAFGPGLVEVEILDDHRLAGRRLGQSDQGGDGPPEPSIPGRGGQPSQVQRHRHRRPHRVAGRVDDHGGEVAGIDVDGQHRVAAQLLERRHLGGRRLPGGVEIPAAPFRLEGDVVADRAGCRLGGHLIAPVGESDGDGQPVAAMGPVGPMGERPGEFHLQPALLRVPADGLVPPRLVGLPIGGEEPTRRLPPLPPLLLAHPGLVEMAASGQTPTPPADRHPPLDQTSLHLHQAGVKDLETALLLEPLRPAAIAPGPAPTLPARHRQAAPQPTHPGPQTPRLGHQIPFPQPPGVLGGAGDRPRPARRTRRRQDPLALPPRHRRTLRVQPALATPTSDIRPRQTPQVGAQLTQHQVVSGRPP